jgi:putative glutamine amidotransferase
MTKKLIGIVGNTLTSNTMFGDMERAYVNATYVKGVLSAGGVPVIIPCFGDGDVIERQVEMCDGFLFSGGGDISPSLYGEEPNSKLGQIDPQIDRFQLKLYLAAEKTGKPVLGICRGLQIINTARGGTLYQDINGQIPDSIQHLQSGKRTHSVHKALVDQDSTLFEIVGTREVAVNSLHHQSVRLLGRDLKISAKAGDGVVEAIESDSGQKILGVQWHPEDMFDHANEMKALFQWLVNQA